MKLISFKHKGNTRTGVLTGEQVFDLSAADAAIPADMLALLEGGDAMLQRLRKVLDNPAHTIPLGQVRLECPLPRPPRIFAVGLNYMDHFLEIPEAIREARGMTPPQVPVIFNKQNTSANGPLDPIYLPPESLQMDYEAELGVVIGKRCRRVSREQAYSVIAGFTIVNDVTIRDWQMRSPTMTMGKSWDSHCPMGPAIVTPDECVDPQNLHVRLWVDEELRQDFNTRNMIFDIAAQIEHLSTAFTLLPGDVIATGTDAGVAMFSEGQPWLREGQTVRVDIDSLGTIENRVELDPGNSFIE
jgi:2-keto-4-pentenoate hydratase/2-oxohepta-3-ene-1,7-dioic acid hydratase in catechol pathway